MWLKRTVNKISPRSIPLHPTAHVTPQQQKTIALHGVAKPPPATKPRTIALHNVVGNKGLTGVSSGAFAAGLTSGGLTAAGLAGLGGLGSRGSSPASSGSSSSAAAAPTAYNAAGIPEAASNPADDWAAGGGGMPGASPAAGDDDLAPFEGATLAQDEPGVVETFLDHMTAPEGAPGPRTGAPGFSTGAKVAVGGGIAAGVVAIAKLLF